MNEPTVKEHGDDETVPLIRGRFIVERTVGYWVRDSAKTAQLGECTCRLSTCSIRTREEEPVGIGIVLDMRDVLHARGISRTQVDLDVWRWTDHRVELRFRLDRRPSKLGYSVS